MPEPETKYSITHPLDNGRFYLGIPYWLTAPEVHRLIAALQAALKKFAPEEIAECPWCNSVAAMPGEEIHNLNRRE